MHKERQVIKEILTVLYGEHDHDKDEATVNPDKDWDGNEAAEIERIIRNHGYVPENAIHMTPEEEISIVWGADDVIDRAAEIYGDIDFEITKEQAIDIVERMKHCHDCNYGITWDTLDYYIDELKHEWQKEQDEQTRRDEKNGLYPGKEDSSN